MSDLKITKHAAIRMSQRAITDADIEIILALGIEIDAGYFVRDDDLSRAIAILKLQIKAIERVRGKLAVVRGGRLVSAYRPSAKKQRILLRH